MLEERGEDNALCWDNALPYSCRLPLTHETNGMGASPWSHPNEGVCHEVKWSEGGRRTEGGGEGGGGKCHKNQGAAARPSRRITAAVKWMWKQEKALRNIDLMPQPEQGKMRAPDYVRSISHPYRTLSPFASTLQRTRERLREDVLLCAVALCEVQLSMWKYKIGWKSVNM